MLCLDSPKNDVKNKTSATGRITTHTIPQSIRLKANKLLLKVTETRGIF